MKSEEADPTTMRLAALTDEACLHASAAAPTQQPAWEESMNDREAPRTHLRAIARDVRARLPADMSSDHGWLYDPCRDSTLTYEHHDFARTDIEPALKV